MVWIFYKYDAYCCTITDVLFGGLKFVQAAVVDLLVFVICRLAPEDGLLIGRNM
jgi:hypothetical protein